jgi:hypothetical protein
MNHSCFSSYLLTSLDFNEYFKILVWRYDVEN